MREWFKVSLQSDAEGASPTTADVLIYDYIGDWLDQQLAEFYGIELAVTPKALVAELSALPDSVKTIRVRINSPGGDMFGGLTIANMLRDQRVSKGRTVETVVEGLAASAASLIFMAGSPARISDNGMLMIHEPWNIAIGNSREMRKNADILDQFTGGSLIPTYQWQTDMEPEGIRTLLEAETWMNADEAVEYGFATEKVEGIKVAASIMPQALAQLKVPERFTEKVAALIRKPEEKPEPEPVVDPPAVTAANPAEVIAACMTAELDLPFAQTLIAAGETLEQVKSKVTAEKTRRTEAATRESQIRAICEQTHLADLADSYVRSGMPAEDVRKQLGIITAAMDGKVVTDGKLGPEQKEKKQRPANVTDITAILAERSKPQEWPH